MISDVLFEAVKEIRRYQRDIPSAYDGDREAIDALCETMDKFGEQLGGAPPPVGYKLISGADMNAKHPETFDIPAKNHRD